MKKILFIIVILISGFAVAQSADQKKILNDTGSFLEMFRKKDYEGIINMIHPVVVQKFNKQSLIGGYKAAMEGNEAYKVELKNSDENAIKVSDIFKSNETQYAFATYPITTIVTFMNEKLDEPKQNAVKATLEGKGMKVKFINDNTMEMSKPSMVVALKDKSTGNEWKYLNYDESNMMLLFVVPDDAMKNAKQYYADFLTKQQENAN
ncbi:hypothetical protein [Chryseobacterium sp. MMS23-Vi53]|uniref:hypothetical protein n=1 Tax=Chryseobacterium sp. MMS23-Vi53 TaxID=3386644 RepID=UPI0039EB66C6